jgi:enoyl-CoA hydratase/carnithine racemase
MVDLIGPARTKDFFFSARHVAADEALAMGLIENVRPDAEIEAFTRSYCARIAENAPLSMTATKQIIAELVRPSSEIDSALCKEITSDCYASEDYIEGRRAFMEKRKPMFKGR